MGGEAADEEVLLRGRERMSSTASAPTIAPPPAATPRKKARESSATWRLTDRIGLGIAWALGLVFCAIAASIVIYLLIQGLHYVRPNLLVTHPTVGYSESQTGGFLDPMIGTLIVAIIAMVIAVPVGIATAVWLSEFGRPAALARVTESTVEMLAGTPTIVLALFGTLVFEAPALGFLSQTNGGVVFGRSFFAAGAMLSLVALPLVVSTVREGLQAIPGHVREASYAVGKTKIATTRRVLLPAARPSVITGAMLGVGRVIGDTAIIVVLLGSTLNLDSVGSTPLLSTLRGTGSTLTSYVFTNAPTGDGNQPDKAYAAAFVLLMIVLVLNVGVDIFARRAKKLRWG
jgi:phosphate transport system permease protein